MDGYDKRESVTFEVAGIEPVPWSAPHTSRWGGSIPNERLVAWQYTVMQAAMAAFGPYSPWKEPITLSAAFTIKRACPGKKFYGKPAVPVFTLDPVTEQERMKGKGPDLTNLKKAVEDAMSGIVYVNDVQVYRHENCHSHWGPVPGVILTLTR